MELGVLLSSTGKVMTYEEAYPRGAPTNLSRKVRADSEVSQTTINTEARDAIKDLFPNIPDSDLNQIIKTAFQKVRPQHVPCPSLTRNRDSAKSGLP